jgi:hypothetical protein
MIMNTRRTGRFFNICMVLESMNSKKKYKYRVEFGTFFYPVGIPRSVGTIGGFCED